MVSRERVVEFLDICVEVSAWPIDRNALRENCGKCEYDYVSPSQHTVSLTGHTSPEHRLSNPIGAAVKERPAVRRLPICPDGEVLLAGARRTGVVTIYEDARPATLSDSDYEKRIDVHTGQ